ncbi:MAG: TRAP transporter large permease subunit [Gammaproteobacteria bacterium]|nr:C4-dicarboxylate ABC transporter [Chromatiales bacterium]MDP6673955.1 TRAP transporter large permease subunit [Gammaproteobacteria bacterium]
MFGILALLALLGTPLFIVIAMSAILGYARSDISLAAVPIEVFGIAEMPILLAIPLFTFAGYLLSESRAPMRIVRLTGALLGWMPGGLALVSIAACAFFTAFTGASGVTIVALGAVLYPALSHAGYTERFSLGLVTSAGSLGLLFAPSLPLILYGIVAEVPIDDLFLAGIMPGIVMMVFMGGYSLWVNRSNRTPLSHFSLDELLGALKASAWEIPLPVIVLGGIYSGYFAVSEAAAVTAVYVLIVEVLVLRDVNWRQLPEIIRESMVLVGGILIILGVSLASTNYMIDAQVPEKLVEIVNRFVSGPVSFLLLLFVFLLILGAILDIFSALVLVVPLILPIAQVYEVHPVHLGIVFLATMQLGFLTPPVGLNLFISSYRFEQSIVRVYLATFPFLMMLLFAVLLITFWPGLSLFMLGE